MTETPLSLPIQLRTDLLRVYLSPSLTEWSDDIVRLFWSIWNPSAIALVSVDPLETQPLDELPPLSPALEDWLLSTLAEWERSTRVAYSPDVPVEIFDGDLWVNLHVAASRAFALKRRDGYSEDVRDCLESAWRAGYRITPSYAPDGDYPGDYLSTYGATGLVAMELFRLRRTEGSHEEALHFLARALPYLSNAILGAQAPSEWLADLFSEETLEAEKRLRGELRDHLAMLTMEAQEPAGVIEHLLNHVRGADWKQVAKDCQTLADYWSECFGAMDEEVTESGGNRTTWLAFLHHACGRAEEKLNPSDLRDVLSQREDQAAEERLRAYFFPGGLWDKLPKRAQGSLINADRIAFSTRRGRIGAALSDLMVATESICHTLVWEPLARSKGNYPFLDYVHKLTGLPPERYQPRPVDYVALCRETFFTTFLASQGLSDEDRLFLAQVLPDALDRLRRLRNTDQHYVHSKVGQDEVQSLVREFLGINCEGILPRLAKIKRSNEPAAQRKALRPLK